MFVRVTLAMLLLAAYPSSAQQAADPLDALVEEERLRRIVETAFSDVHRVRDEYSDDTAFVEAFTDIARRLGDADPGVVPFLSNEAMLADPTTFHLATYGLALQGTAEAIEGLYASIERANREDSNFAKDRKAQLVWSLAAAGDVGALEAASSGPQNTVASGAYRHFSVFEAAVMMNVPESLAVIHAELSAENVEPPGSNLRTRYGLMALSRIGHPSSLPVLLRHLRSEHAEARFWAARGLGYYAADASLEALLEAIHDERPAVAGNAARSLFRLAPAGRFQTIAEQLPHVGSEEARGYLYRALAAIDPQAAVPLLVPLAGSRPPYERKTLCEALGGIEADAVLELLIDQVADPAAAECAVTALSLRDHPRARRVLLRAIDSDVWRVALKASQRSAEIGLVEAAAVIRRRLVKRELPRVAEDLRNKNEAELLLGQLVRLADLEAIEELESALETQRSPSLVAKIEDAIKQLRAVRDAGKKKKKWEAMIFDADPALRRMAYAHIGRALPADAAGELLARAFGRVETDEARAVLEGLTDIDSPASRSLVEAILTAPEYQRPDFYALRDLAAWAARRYGGERMSTALERSIELRDGRDLRPIIYYALLRGSKAIPLIQRYLAPRLRYKSVFRGVEYERLRRLLQVLELGQPLDYTDFAPRLIVLS